ncbi:MAG TPA: DUF6600 domain-containing protein [Candidatus Acidoferrales bacterium]|nr:DUF6600 domain-containing protein [Candidatus Acidoferrales bacterium]
MKESIKKIFGAVVLLLVFLALSPGIEANAQNPVPPAAQSSVDNSVRPPTLPPQMDPNSPLGQVIQMVQSGAAENAVVAYIAHSSTPFNLSAADVTYLNDLGTPLDIQTAMVQRNQQLGASAEAEPTPASPGQTQDEQDVTEDYFYSALAPYGTWINLPGYGLCWQPCAVAYDANWTPYGTFGQWVYTDDGWYWLSGYSWGWAVFHYGRWFHDAQRGWCWWPSTAWGPSWVFWRYEGGYCGWAPLPPHCYYGQEPGTASNGLLYNGSSVAANYDFGMGAELFNFVPMANVFDGNVEHFRLSAAEAAQVFARSKVLNNISSSDRTIINEGIPVTRIAAATGKGMRSFTIQPAKSAALPGARGEQIMPDGETLAINRPYFNTSVPSALKQGVWPIAGQAQPVAHRAPTIIVNENPLTYPPADNQSSVIYVDSAGQNGPPVPTVTTAGPQDSANASGGGESAQSYWAGSVEASAPAYSPSSYMSPRLQSRQHWEQKAQQPANHREFNPPAGQPVQHQENHGAPSHSDSTAHNAPAHAGPSSPASGQNHGR